ncbi:hypothetical protein PC116_g21518 [Phytophthora cactorum]|nr:hypothetical protein PC120_g24652 [Phytophthora cactorum]KAG3140285.1 hypothetical protein PC128_g25221 [Phytophthora cactorum]KAG4039290.1 hypothetical protein PC123_g25158 [Phytophthora cactorum]KAG4230175.1 hypothetical protein PC116_g21518 [Phytophthora cactorum]
MCEEELGTRGKKPGPKPKHKRRAARPGSAAGATVALRQ